MQKVTVGYSLDADKAWGVFRNSPLGNFLRSLVPVRIVNSFFHLPLAILAVVYYRYPAKKLRVIGVTGTDGKTTTASLLHQILIRSGRRTALISTVSAKIGNKEIPTGFHVTSPHPFRLQQLLREIVDKNYQDVILESTSHGLAQNRLFGCNFYLGIITNVTHEHLDYHRSFDNYLKAKSRLFSKVKIAVLNRDDGSFQYLKKVKLKNEKTKIITYGINSRADFTPKTFQFETSLPGEFNRYNCLAAIAAASSLGLPKEKIRKTVAFFRGVAGRMQEIEAGQDFRVIVDFAHTPNALENVLKTLRSSGRLIVVFGCAGLRDKQKRPLMGQIAAKYADLIVLTAEDPRTEDVNKIINQIAGGCLRGGAREVSLKNTSEVARRDSSEVEGKGRLYDGKKPKFFKVSDRRKAIRFAIQKLAKNGDLLIICGKGHEQSMCFGKTERPWSDEKEAREAL